MEEQHGECQSAKQSVCGERKQTHCLCHEQQCTADNQSDRDKKHRDDSAKLKSFAQDIAAGSVTDVVEDGAVEEVVEGSVGREVDGERRDEDEEPGKEPHDAQAENLPLLAHDEQDDEDEDVDTGGDGVGDACEDADGEGESVDESFPEGDADRLTCLRVIDGADDEPDGRGQERQTVVLRHVPCGKRKMCAEQCPRIVQYAGLCFQQRGLQPVHHRPIPVHQVRRQCRTGYGIDHVAVERASLTT